MVMTETGEYAFPGESDALSVLPACIQNVSNMDTECIQDVSRMDTEVRLGKASQGEASQGKKNRKRRAGMCACRALRPRHQASTN